MDVIDLVLTQPIYNIDVIAAQPPTVVEVQAGLKGPKGDPGTGSGNVSSVNGYTGVIVLAASDVGAVPTTRTVNGKALGSNITLTSDDITDGTTNRLYTNTEKTKLGGIATGATANSTDAQLRDRSTHTGTQTADTVVDGTTNKAYTATEKTKLAGIATAATANATDSALRDRSTHTGTQTSITISDFTEAVQDAVASLLSSGSNVTLTYNDAANTLTVDAAGGDAETMRDTIGAALVGVGNIAVTVNDAADTITISTTATVNSTDASLRDRSTHTGTQSADTITDGTTNKAYTATEKTKLSGIATAATANSTDASLRDRSTHTGTQSADSLTDGTTNKAFLATERTKLTGIATGATANSTDTFLLSRANHTGTQAISTITSLQTSLDAKAAIADLYGTGANQWGIRPTLYWTGSAWPTRTVPAGYTGPVIWDSSTDVAATAPSTANVNDLWDQYVG